MNVNQTSPNNVECIAEGHSHFRQQSLFRNQQTTCEYARAFLPKKNNDFEESLSQYLLGSLTLSNIARAFYHNNVFHQSSTIEQLGELVKVIRSREDYGEYHNAVKMIKDVMVAVEKVEVFYAVRGYVPASPCIKTDLEGITLFRIF